MITTGYIASGSHKHVHYFSEYLPCAMYNIQILDNPKNILITSVIKMLQINFFHAP